MNPDLRERLRRLGVHKGASHLKPSPQAEYAQSVPRNAAPLRSNEAATLEPVRTALGVTYVRRARYTLAHVHGDRALSTALAYTPENLVQLLTRRECDGFDLRSALFLDTETTGLAGGAGTLAFLVGIGYFNEDQFVIEQYFLREPAEEAAMLAEIDRQVNQRAHLVTFNGQSFDVPLLESRYTLSRIAPSFEDKTHLDLLMPARRVWRGSLESCSLGSLEYHLLGVRREQRDVPGSVIPYLYREYLSAGGGDLNDDMQRVMYHNLHDILSMVTLVARLMDVLVQPASAEEHFAAARYRERQGDRDAAKAGYREAIKRLAISDSRLGHAQSAPTGSSTIQNPKSEIANLHFLSLRRLANCLKQECHHDEAALYWRQLADGGDAEAMIEMAKHHEWRAVDLPAAMDYAKRARDNNNDPALRPAIEHRLARLNKKLASKKINAETQSNRGAKG
jgi:uncharacterized protein YprB with RNaseH-like and TPR domain